MSFIFYRDLFKNQTNQIGIQIIKIQFITQNVNITLMWSSNNMKYNKYFLDNKILLRLLLNMMNIQCYHLIKEYVFLNRVFYTDNLELFIHFYR